MLSNNKNWIAAIRATGQPGGAGNRQRFGPGIVPAVGGTINMLWLGAAQARSQQSPPNSSTASDAVLTWKPSNINIRQNGIGEGFEPGTRPASFEAGAGYGLKIFGSKEHHDLALTGLSYDYVLGIEARYLHLSYAGVSTPTVS